jgi:hypothetical protein
MIVDLFFQTCIGRRHVRQLRQSGLLSQRRIGRQRAPRQRDLWGSATADALCTECDHRGAEVSRHGCIMADWSRVFDDPIPLPHGRQVVALKDAANHIQKLPKAAQD